MQYECFVGSGSTRPGAPYPFRQSRRHSSAAMRLTMSVQLDTAPIAIQVEMSAPADLLQQLKELGVSDKTAKYALEVGAEVDTMGHRQADHQRYNNDVTKAADYGESWGRRLVCGILRSRPRTCVT